MAGELFYSAIVNQKLAFARIALAASDAQQDDINGRVARHAHLDAAVGQMCCGLSYFVAELAEQYNVNLDPTGEQLPELMEGLAERAPQATELGELLNLRKQNDSWLRELLRARRNPLYLAQRFRSEHGNSVNPASIPAVDLTTVDNATAQELVGSWCRAAQSLVDRLRASLHEE
ncbi:DUF6586 family protein [Gilvimarinus sp. F26214L]|uniref:DUF6586 family protein n=1 Tax=Gilvimarinus sp. DZF01 TaxID=3461371 RepID=UPI004045999A